MAIEEILKYILDNAKKEEAKIIQEAQLKANQLINETKLTADNLYQEGLKLKEDIYLKLKEREIVNVRLLNKQKVLQVKQALINKVFEAVKNEIKAENLKKSQIRPEGAREIPLDIKHYMDKFKRDYESEVSRIIFTD